jgi:hypothetical protein
MPSIAEREDVLLFLTRESELGARMPVGLAQGKLSVATDKDGRKVLKREIAALELVPAPDVSPRRADEGAVLDYVRDGRAHPERGRRRARCCAR